MYSKEITMTWNPNTGLSDNGNRAGYSVCVNTGKVHEITDIALYVRNCDEFPADHPEFGHCESCGTARCMHCGDPQTWRFKNNGNNKYGF